VAADVIDPCVAAAIPIKSGDGVNRAGFERLAEDVARRPTPAFAAASVIPQHCRVLLAMPPLALGLSLEATP
jgi:hypothetical protein